MKLFGEQTPRLARAYILSVIFVGTLVLAFSLYRSVTGSDFRWIYIACLAIFAIVFRVQVPWFGGKIQSLTLTINDIFVFTAILLFGPPAAVTIVAIESIALSTISKLSLPKVLFNVTQLSLVTFTVGNTFYAIQGTPPPLLLNQITVPNLFMELGLCAILYFALNTLAVAAAIGLTTNRKVFTVWKNDFLWLSLPTFSGASAAAIIFVYFDSTPLFAIAVAGPIVLIIHYAYKLQLDRIRQTQKHFEELNSLYHSTIESLAMAIDAKDANTHGHIQRVNALALHLAEYCGMDDPNQLEGLRAASLLHDIGKLAISEYILNKPSPLTRWEEQRIRKHPDIGADILGTVPFPYPVIPFVRHHHEKWDGSGYPDGLKRTEIPLGARILSVADCYDALRSDRPYRRKLDREMALQHLQAESGKSYDPAIVEQLVAHVDELEQGMQDSEIRLNKNGLSLDPPTDESTTETRRKRGNTVFHEIASTHKEIQTLYEISRVLGKSLKLDETLSLLADKIGNLIPYTSAAIFLLDSQEGKLIPYHAVGMHSDEIENIELFVGDGITGWVAAHKQYLMNVSPAPDFVKTENLSDAFRNCLVMPLTLGDSIVGVISLYSTQSGEYHQDHLRFMETIADHAATAIRNAIIYEETQENAYTDLLTGLPNLRFFHVFMDRELKRVSRMDQPLTLLMMDLENFKEINDRFGHEVGNRLLVQISQLLADQMRDSDKCIRYAGDEFIAVLPGLGKEQSQGAIKRIQKKLEKSQFEIDGKQTVNIGISIGAASFPEDGRNPDLLLVVADQAMYRDKFERRNRQQYPAEVVPMDKKFEQSS